MQESDTAVFNVHLGTQCNKITIMSLLSSVEYRVILIANFNHNFC